ncbi:amidohydrolase [Polaromonas sp.]|uniref:amidohydrolase n=1 Tax=Polaromonas sp. TaxID=1869339 RepID=UPI003BAB3D24
MTGTRPMPGSAPGVVPTLILHGGRIHTGDATAGTVQAVAIRGHEVLEVGTDAQVLRNAGPDTQRVDLAGRTAIPGMTDGHAHLDREGLRHQLPSLAKASSVEDVLDVIADEVRRHPPGSWIVTQPLGQPPEYQPGPGGLAGGRIPNRHDLDRVSPQHAVYIRPIWGYWRNATPLVSVANSLALARAGIGPHTRSPSPDVVIEADAQGAPTGVFYEHTLVPLVEHTLMRAAPGFTAAQREAGLRHAMGQYNRVGTTAVFEGHGVASEVVQAYKAVHAAGDCSVRAVLTFSPNWQLRGQGDAAQLLSDWGAWLGGRGMGDAWLRMQGLYAELDAEPENNRLRAANHPCTGWAGFQAGCALPQDALEVLVVEAARAGIRLAGIWPNLLPLFERANRAHPIAPLRWVWGHQSVLTREQIARIKDLGLVITTHTNRHIYKDGDRLMQRQQPGGDDIVPLRRLREEGIDVAFGSDNLPPSLFGPIWHATARQSRSGQAVGPDQAITREQALHIATRGGAYLCFDEHQRGTLAPGMLADVAVLNADPLSCQDEVLPHIHADMTVVHGRVIDLPDLPSRSP